jgi:hypothetical protein
MTRAATGAALGAAPANSLQQRPLPKVAPRGRRPFGPTPAPESRGPNP